MYDYNHCDDVACDIKIFIITTSTASTAMAVPLFQQFFFGLTFIYVTVFWKTDHIDTRTEIHLLPVRA